MTAARHRLRLIDPGQDARRERKQRYRRRLRDGTVMVTIPVSLELVSMLIDLNWLPLADSEDRGKIADAIAALLNDAAKRSR